MATEGNGGAGGRGGLVLGAVLFAGVLAGPLLVPLPGAVRTAGGLFALVAGGFFWWRSSPRIGALLCGFGGALLLASAGAGMPLAARCTLAVTGLMASWWITVALPIAATSLVPIVLFPVLGVIDAKAVTLNYADRNVFLFMGGFIVALGIQRWGLHRRIALKIIGVVGTNPTRMVLGFMVASAFLSMWISNTATTLMMLPIALAVIASLSDVEGVKLRAGFAPAVLLGTAHAASIGGLATPIGTPPNISFLRILEQLFPEAPTFSFGQWLLAFLPIVVLFLPLAWLVITRIHRPGRGRVTAGREVIREQLSALGPLRGAERRVLVVFTLTALLWMTRKDLVLGAVTIPGWATGLEHLIGPPFDASNLHDATVAMAMAILLFILPGDPDESGRRRALMDWDTAKRLPWGILLLFGGGFALAQAFRDSGLSEHLGKVFAVHAARLGPTELVAGTCGVLSFLTEVTSNTATTEVMLPVLADTVKEMGRNPLLLMLPATLSASCAFMLPIATPPNAIVFGSGKLTMWDMIRTGILLNLLGVLLVTVVFFWWAAPVLGLDLGTLPDWAVSGGTK